ncbi:MAG: rhomboid family intramembrane serine protease [Myxococcota bacterium]
MGGSGSDPPRIERLQWDEFEARIRAGRIPPESEIRFAPLTGERFVRADELELVRSLRDDGALAWEARFGSGVAPIVTALLLGLQIRVWWWSQIDGGVLATSVFGNAASLVFEEHQVWRLITMGLVHVELMHILSNGLWFAYTGWNLERALGRTNLAVVFGASVVGGSTLSAWFSPYTFSIGASGGVFGMVAASVVFGLVHPELLPARGRRWFGLALLPYLVLMFWSGLRGERVDNWAHFGGLATGLVLGALLDPDEVQRRPRWNHRVRLGVLTGVAGVLATAALLGPRIAPLVDAVDARIASRPPSQQAAAAAQADVAQPVTWSVPPGWRTGSTAAGDLGFVSPVGSGERRAVWVGVRTDDQLVDPERALARWTERLLRRHPDATVATPAPSALAGREALAAIAQVPGDPPLVVEWRGVTRGAWVLEGTWQTEVAAASRLQPLGDRVWRSVGWGDPPELVQAQERFDHNPHDPSARLALIRERARIGEIDAALASCDEALARDPADRSTWSTCLDALAVAAPPADVLDRWLARALEAPPGAHTRIRVADALDRAGRPDVARGLLEIEWVDAPGDSALRKARRRLGLPTELVDGVPAEWAFDPITGDPRPADVLERWIAWEPTLADAQAAGEAWREERGRSTAAAVAAILVGDPAGIRPLVALKVGYLPAIDADVRGAVADELASAAAGKPQPWIPPEVIEALATRPDYPTTVRAER